MTLRVLADENIPEVDTILGPGFDVVRSPGRSLCRGQLGDVDAILVRSVTRVDADLLEGTPVRFVGTATSGIDHVDVGWLQRTGIDFAFAPGANANSVVEYVIAAIAHTGDFLEQLQTGGAVGVVGYGLIGKALVARLSALGIAYRVFDPWLPEADVPERAALEDVLGCDLICLHPELTHREPWPSYHLLGKSELAVIGKDQLLINASRGPVIDNAALLERLNSANSPAVVLDVWEHEPQVDAELLAKVDLGTAHIAGYSFDGKVQATRMLCSSMVASLGVDPPERASGGHSDASPVSLPAKLSIEDSLRVLIRSCYRIEEDDQLLRNATMHGNRAKQAVQFDQLRKNYARRRELAGQQVVVEDPQGPQAQLVRAMGCVPVAGQR